MADSSPLNYLVWIEQVEILPALFERIFVPEVVQNELRVSTLQQLAALSD
ncbi:MAG TPA: hypothetical protein VNZ53_31575 [Steroidobacteraceae bacterium]|nr:hypothetical protein [Steroidobacteraceae bacterium]